MRRLLTFLAMVALVACAAEAPREAPRASAAPAPPAAVIDTPAPFVAQPVARLDTAAGPPPGPVTAEARTACDEAAATWATVPGASLRRGDTLVRPGDRIGDSMEAFRDTGPVYAACLVYGYLEQYPDSVVRERLSWVDWSVRGRGRNGWGYLWRYQADGPDGSN